MLGKMSRTDGGRCNIKVRKGKKSINIFGTKFCLPKGLGRSFRNLKITKEDDKYSITYHLEKSTVCDINLDGLGYKILKAIRKEGESSEIEFKGTKETFDKRIEDTPNIIISINRDFKIQKSQDGQININNVKYKLIEGDINEFKEKIKTSDNYKFTFLQKWNTYYKNPSVESDWDVSSIITLDDYEKIYLRL